MVVQIDAAGFGVPIWVWTGMRKNEGSVLEVGRQRAMREEGGFSYRNAYVLEADQVPAAMLIGYRLDDPYDAGDLAETPEFVRPLVELESLVPGSWYVNVLAVHAEYRGKGYGIELIRYAETIAAASGAKLMSSIVEDRNASARKVHEKCGFSEVARRSRVAFAGDFTGSTEWILLTKQVAGQV
jgi:ribosomal protein S18 acetylase RimI-like enzyme